VQTGYKAFHQKLTGTLHRSRTGTALPNAHIRERDGMGLVDYLANLKRHSPDIYLAQGFNPIPQTGSCRCPPFPSPHISRYGTLEDTVGYIVSDEGTTCDRRWPICATCRVTFLNRFESMKPVIGWVNETAMDKISYYVISHLQG